MSTIYGNKVERYKDQPNDVIGKIERSMTGNLILRIGSINPDGHSWCQDKHVVLVPGEIEQFLNEVNSVMTPDPQVRL